MADHEAAYKQIPMGPAGQPYAIIALRDPTTGRWYGFRSRARMFGSVAAVLHYNVFPRLITVIFNRMFGIPLVFFFDDFSALLPRLLATKGLAVFSLLRVTGHQIKGCQIGSRPRNYIPRLTRRFPL